MSDTNVHISAPDSYIIAYPYQQEQTTVGSTFAPSMLETNPILITKDIINISTSKGKGGSGSWHATLGSSQNYKAKLHPGCWVLVYINDNNYDQYSDASSEQSGLKMMGIIRSLRCIESTSGDGTRSIRYEISGDDFHSVLETSVYVHSLWRVQSTNQAQADQFVYLNGGAFSPLNPTEMLTVLLDTILNRAVGASSKLSLNEEQSNPIVGGSLGIPPQLLKRIGGSSIKFNDVLQKFLQPDLLGKITKQPTIGEQWTIWGLLKSYSHSILNELYTDLIIKDGKIQPGLVFRAIPFSVDSEIKSCKKITVEDKSVQLYTSKKIEENEIVNLNYGKSDAERFNLFLISSVYNNTGVFGTVSKEVQVNVKVNKDTADLAAQAGSSSDFSKLGDADSIARFGLRPYIQSTEYNVESEGVAEVNSVVKDMWSKGHLYENGQVTIVGSPEHIPVGTNIEFSERKWIAHVEGVSHHYSAHGNGEKSFYTTISFVRLQTKNGQPIDMIERGKRDTDPGSTHSEGEEYE